MQIEQFDTGLKTKTNVKDIVISPEQNFQNKNLIRSHLNQIVNFFHLYPISNYYICL